MSPSWPSAINNRNFSVLPLLGFGSAPKCLVQKSSAESSVCSHERRQSGCKDTNLVPRDKRETASVLNVLFQSVEFFISVSVTLNLFWNLRHLIMMPQKGILTDINVIPLKQSFTFQKNTFLLRGDAHKGLLAPTDLHIFDFLILQAYFWQSTRNLGQESFELDTFIQ